MSLCTRAKNRASKKLREIPKLVQSKTLKCIRLHDNIWFNAMRAFKPYKSRKGSDNHDHVVDNLIRTGHIDRNKEEVTPAIQQFLRYPAIMADRLTKSHINLVRQVGWLLLFIFIEVLSLLIITLVVWGV